MALVIFQLSDFHFSSKIPNNPAIDRIEELIVTLRANLAPSDLCILIFSGDIANEGDPSDYQLASQFFENINSELTAHLDQQPNYAIVPGNHDLDFNHEEYDEQIREALIDKFSPTNPPTSEANKILLKPQEPFRNFVNSLSKKYPIHTVTELYNKSLVVLGEEQIQILLLNTTRFTLKKEKKGRSWFPVDLLSTYLSENPTDNTLSIGILHHPYSWFRTNNANDLKTLLENNCDILFSGHEHYGDHFLKTRKSSEQNLYVEGGILQNHERNHESTLNIVKIDRENKIFRCKSYSWNGQSYEEKTEESVHRFLRLRQEVRNRFELTEDWNYWLKQIGTDFRHPRTTELELSDLFVYPDLLKLDAKRSFRPSGLVRDREVLGYIQEKRKLLITGNEKLGKTSLCKTLFRDLREAGIIPIILRSEFTVHSRKDKSIEERLKIEIDSLVKKTFGTDALDKFWGNPVGNRAIILDDYDRLALSLGGRDSLLKWCCDNFGVVVVTAYPDIRVQEILNREQSDTILWAFEHAEILESDRETRDALIVKWLVAGEDPFEISEEELYKHQVRYARIIDSIIGQGLMPSVPLFILMMMQQIETRGVIDNTAGLYGSLYELIIRDVIRSICKKPTDIEVILTYLSNFAFHLYHERQRSLDSSAFRSWHELHLEEYNLILPQDEILEQLQKAGVFRRNSDFVGFKYRYYYCYFLARFLSDNFYNPEIVEEVRSLSQNLFNVYAANTMLFLCHLSKDPRILEMVLQVAKNHFSEADKYDLSLTPSVVPKELIVPIPLTISDTTSAPAARRRSLREKDSIDPPHGLDELTEEEEEIEELDENVQLINEVNSAQHTIRICGQILRNHYGILKGKQQIKIIRECYDLCLRLLGVLYDVLERDKKEVTGTLAQILHHRSPGLTEKELDKRTREFTYFIVIGFCYSLIKHTSDSIGLADLRASFDKIIGIEDISISERILDLSTRLDYFEEFPKERIHKIVKELRSRGVGYEALRRIVYEHMKLFVVSYDDKQSTCKVLNISLKREELMGKKDKLIKQVPKS